MTASNVILTIRQLARDTFRQSLASGIFWVMLGISAVCILVCLSVRVKADFDLPSRGSDPAEGSFLKEEVSGGSFSLAFGAVPVPIGRDRIDAIRFIQLALAGGVADSLGVLLVLVWTSGFLPGFLEPSAASVLLAKPISRWSLLAGKYLGVLMFVAFHATIFVWAQAALGRLASREANTCIPSSSCISRSSTASRRSWSLAPQHRHRVRRAGVLDPCWGKTTPATVVTRSDFEEVSPGFRFLVEAGYWVLPKPADFGIFLYNGLNAEGSFDRLPAFAAVDGTGFFLELSIFSSLAFAVVMIAMSAYEFAHTDY